MAILFRKEDREFYFLSNFSPHGFHHDGIYYKTNEHFYQSRKAASPTIMEMIANASGPWQAREYGKPIAKGGLIEWNDAQVKYWDSIRIIVMMQGLIEKFSQNADILEKLKSTGNEELIEFAPWDEYWGNGKQGQGQNMLGQCLMAVRDTLMGIPYKIGWPQ